MRLTVNCKNHTLVRSIVFGLLRLKGVNLRGHFLLAHDKRTGCRVAVFEIRPTICRESDSQSDEAIFEASRRVATVLATLVHARRKSDVG